jgi:hypothetical protein
VYENGVKFGVVFARRQEEEQGHCERGVVILSADIGFFGCGFVLMQEPLLDIEDIDGEGSDFDIQSSSAHVSS